MNYSFLRDTDLFRGIDDKGIETMLGCLSAKTKSYRKDSFIFNAGETITSIGMVLSGAVNIEHNDYWGNKTVISHISAGSIFGETYACLTNQPILVDAVASENAEILLMNIGKILHSCSNSCTFHESLIRNLLIITAQKNLILSQRMFHTSFKSLRAKLLSYFSEQEMQAGSNCFTIPFNRQQLANYLNADRSAMCSEISKMKNDGIISVSKNTFTLLDNEHK